MDSQRIESVRVMEEIRQKNENLSALVLFQKVEIDCLKSENSNLFETNSKQFEEIGMICIVIYLPNILALCY